MRFVGRRLSLARAFRSLTQPELGKQVAASKTLISLVETEQRQPTADLVEAFGEVLGFSADFFFQPIKEEFTDAECSFRKRASTPQRLKDQVLAKGTLLGELVGYLHRALTLPSYDVPRIPAQSVEAAEEAATECRLYWGLGLDSPIVTLGRVLENAGVFLVQLDTNFTKIDAFCRWGEVSVIVLNTAKGSASRALFDVSHETGHLVMHRGLPVGDKERESEADRFAAAFLLPQEGFSRDFLSLPRLDWPHLFELKRHWRVSVAAMLHRAYELHLTDAATYRRMVKQLYARGWHRGEPVEPAPESPELLGLAFESLRRDLKQTPYDIAAKLNWAPATLSEIAGVPLGEPPVSPVGTVLSLSEYRHKRKAAG